MFGVKSFYYAFSSHAAWLFFLLEEHLDKQGPLRVTLFVWIVALGKILTLDSFRKRHVILIEKKKKKKKKKKDARHSDGLMLYVQEEREIRRSSFTPLPSGSCPNGWWSCWLVGEASLVAIVI